MTRRDLASKPARARRDRLVVQGVCRWFAGAARDLPWRKTDPKTGERDPYRSLVSEFMLQQTQVSRVLEKFDGFIERFPNVASLARAELGEVLGAWSGLGYYRRARHLHAAAKAILHEFQGRVPRGVEELVQLPGVGRYTAGAIASMVYGDAAPLVDGNVARVLLRVEGKQLDQARGMAWAWQRAEGLVLGAASSRASQVGPGAFNEGLMELGALICTPAAPRCGQCPLVGLCRARSLGLQSKIPRPKERGERASITHSCVLIRDGVGRTLMERRPHTGLWAGLWQAPTLETAGRPSPKKLAAWIGLKPRKRLGAFTHHTTHRLVEFVVWDGGSQAPPPNGVERVWISSTDGLPIGNAQKRVLEFAGTGP